VPDSFGTPPMGLTLRVAIAAHSGMSDENRDPRHDNHSNEILAHLRRINPFASPLVDIARHPKPELAIVVNVGRGPALL
jgi:hypothetical protein